MRETLANRTLTYGLLGLFVLMVAVPLSSWSAIRWSSGI